MPFVLTEDSGITCPHQGRIKFTPNPKIKLKVSGKRVIVGDDVQGAKKISGCTTPRNLAPPPPTPPTKPCENVVIIAGSSSKLKVNGKEVLTKALMATTDGIVPPPAPPPIPLTDKEQQSKLTTI